MNIRLLPKVFPRSAEDRQAKFERSLIQREAEIGGKLFGPVPKGHKRQFFCLDEHTWIWHEEWTANGKRHSVVTRYDVRPNGVIKSQNGHVNQRLTPAEARHLYRAAELYQEQVDADYRQLLKIA